MIDETSKWRVFSLYYGIQTYKPIKNICAQSSHRLFTKSQSTKLYHLITRDLIERTRKSLWRTHNEKVVSYDARDSAEGWLICRSENVCPRTRIDARRREMTLSNLSPSLSQTCCFLRSLLRVRILVFDFSSPLCTECAHHSTLCSFKLTFFSNISVTKKNVLIRR